VIAEQPAIRVYLNPYNAVVIMRRGVDQDDDHFVWVRPEHISTLINALRRYLPK